MPQGSQRRRRPLVADEVVRSWAAGNGIDLTDGNLPEDVIDLYLAERQAPPPARSVPAPSRAPRAHTGHPVVLVVDDEDQIREWLRLSLSMEGWVVEEATSAEEALAHWDDYDADVAILDHRLGTMSGLDLAGQLRDRSPDVRLILFSAYFDDAVEKKARRLRLLPLSKPDHQALFRVLALLHDEITGASTAAV